MSGEAPGRRILVLEPYFGGSHRSVLECLLPRLPFEHDLLTLPARKWKWRMRHAAVTLADQVRAALDAGAAWDAILCSDMLNLAEFRGLVPDSVRRLPCVAYFHENQLTYPFRFMGERDLHFG